MPDTINEKLTGGTFFTLLLQACKTSIYRSHGLDGRADKLKAPEVLQALLNIFNPSISYPGDGTAKSDCSEFKSCKVNSTSWIDIENRNNIVSFSADFDHKYYEVLKRTDDLFNIYVDTDNEYKINKLGRALLELIKNDDDIDEDDEFYILETKGGLLKKDIIPELEYSIQPLVLGVWYYIITKKIANESGRETYLHWHNINGNHYTFKSDIGEDEFNNAVITICDISTLEDTTKTTVTIPATASENSFNKIFKKYEKYYKKESKEVNIVKTILYKNSPALFSEIYVASDLTNKITNGSKENSLRLEGEKLCTKNYLETFGRFTSITAPGGYGKSMLMKHLFLNESNKGFSRSFKTGLVPILIKIRSFHTVEASLERMLYNNVNKHMQLDFDDFIKDLEDGGFLLLFDGLDEINNAEIDAFFKQLEILTIKYPNNYFITSSRPSESMESLNKFEVLELCKLSNEQAQKLIKNLPNYEEEEKEKFCSMIEQLAISKWRNMIETPLLLTLMFKVFVGNKKFPAKTHQFYEKAFEVLYEEHDKLKGHEPRPFKTGLKKTSFALLFSEFSYFSSTNPRKYLTGAEIAKNLRKTSFPNIDPDDFIDDMIDNLNLLYKENGDYHFVHGSFQECFCALYLSEYDDDNFAKLSDWFEGFRKIKPEGYLYFGTKGKDIFAFLLSICRERTQKNIIYPYLDTLLVGPMKNPFLNFIYNTFGNIEYGFETVMIPNKHFAKILIELRGLSPYVDFYQLKLPETKQFQRTGFYMIPLVDNDGDWQGYERWDDNDLVTYLKKHPDETEESLGIKQGTYNVYDYEIPTQELENGTEEMTNIVSLLESENSVLYKMYKKIYAYKEK